MATNQPGGVIVKTGTLFARSIWALTATNTYKKIDPLTAKLQLSVAGALSGLYAIDGVTPNAGDLILVTQGTPATDGIYIASSGAWTAWILVSELPDGVTVNVFAGNSAPSIYMAQN